MQNKTQDKHAYNNNNNKILACILRIYSNLQYI
jgi:hypothetical protein